MRFNNLFSKKPKKETETVMKSNSEVDNDYFFRQDFLEKSRITDLDEAKVEDLVRLYNAELISLWN